MKQSPQQYAHILQYIYAVEEMQNGNFDMLIHVDSDDILGRLGKALVGIGRTMQGQSKYIHALTNLVEKINAGSTTEEILNQIYDAFNAYIPYDRIGFSRIDNDNTVVSLWARTNVDKVKLEVGYEASLEGSSLNEIIESGQPRIINDLEEYLRDHPLSKSTQLVVEEGMRASLTCPLIAEKKPIGFLFFSSTQPHAYENVHTELFMQIAGIIAVSLEKAQLYERLVELNDIKNKFLGMTVHDLRNPIAIIKGFIDLLLLQENDSYQEKVLEHIRGQSNKMLSLIGDILDITSIESGELRVEFKLMDVLDLLCTAIDTNRLIAKSKKIDIENQLPQSLPEVMIDPERINQVIDNIISNAIKFSNSHTTITVKAYEKDSMVCIAITDQGQGIPENEREKLFKPYSKISVRPTGGEKSTGLGLAIVKKIIDIHKGKIFIDSIESQGTTVTFCLPVPQISGT